MPDASTLAQSVLSGDRRAVAKAITLAESTLASDRAQAQALLQQLLPHTGGAIRVGLSGVPGAGKSTLIEALGLKLIKEGRKLAVLAVDPTSTKTGGSILGDKTRMEHLSMEMSAFIRPSPAGDTLGGVARRTRDAMLICEAAGFDVVLIETVGVGQSEAAVADLVDLFVMILAPGAGDELQGIKRGVLELADLVVINKADGELATAAKHAAADYRHALALLRSSDPEWRVPVLQTSAIKGDGLDELWDTVSNRHRDLKESNQLTTQRSRQALAILQREIELALVDELRSDSAAKACLAEVKSQVIAGELTPEAATQKILTAFRSRR